MGMFIIVFLVILLGFWALLFLVVYTSVSMLNRFIKDPKFRLEPEVPVAFTIAACMLFYFVYQFLNSPGGIIPNFG